MHLHLQSRSTWLKQGPFPPIRLCCPYHHQYYEPLRLLTRLPLGFRLESLYRSLRWLWYHRPDEISPVPTTTFPTSHSPYAGGFFGAASQVLHTFLGLRFCVTSSTPSSSLFRANLSTLQDSLYVTVCWFALLSQEVTSLQHNQSPGCTGCLLPGRLTVTRTGLPPASSC